MRQAVISDIHGNAVALNAVLRHIEAQLPAVERIVCLGDVVGYGPEPARCVDLVREHCDLCLMGNHEWAVLHEPEGFSPLAVQAVQWTKAQLGDPERLAYLRSLSSARHEDEMLYVHGSIRDPLMDYVREPADPPGFREARKTLQEEFTDFDTCFTGHNHRAFLVTEEGFLFPHEEFKRFHVRGAKVYVCVGSVGQPRDGDPRASYVIADDGWVEYMRVPYDVKQVADQIRGTGLPEILADRLEFGR